MRKFCTALAASSLAIALVSSATLSAQQPAAGVQVARAAAASKAQPVLDQAAQEGKFTFVLFYKQNDAATAAMNKTLQESIAKETQRAVMTYAYVSDPAEQALVAKFDVSRAPMPLTIAVAPNGAITGMFAQQLPAENIAEAFVTPTMMNVMKSLQEGKIVLVTVQGSAKATAPTALRELQADPHFNTRLVSLNMSAADPRETMFLGQMEIDPRTTTTYSALLAPPGVLVGKFTSTATKAEIATALAQAGKCCDDPNCKHNQAAQQQAAPKK